MCSFKKGPFFQYQGHTTNTKTDPFLVFFRTMMRTFGGGGKSFSHAEALGVGGTTRVYAGIGLRLI